MKTAMGKIEAMLSAGQKPSYSDLEDALAQCLQERNAFGIASSEISAWMAKIVFARLHKNESALFELVDTFIAKAVTPYLPADVAINTPNGMVH